MRNIFILLLSMNVCGVFAQNVWKQEKIIDAQATQVEIDQLNNLYLVKRGLIRKLDMSGKEITRFSNRLIGDDLQLDVSNPLKVLLFSPDQMRVMFLDSRLGELQQEINLFAKGYEQISLAATSHSNGFWLYDPILFRLIRYDQFLKKEHESLNIAQLLRIEFFPTSLLEVDNKVYLSDPKHGVYVFDVFGNYIKKIPIKGIEKLIVSDKRLFFSKGGKLFAFNLTDLSEEIVDMGREVDVSFAVNRNMICLVEEEEVHIYTPKR